MYSLQHWYVGSLSYEYKCRIYYTMNIRRGEKGEREDKSEKIDNINHLYYRADVQTGLQVKWKFQPFTVQGAEITGMA